MRSSTAVEVHTGPQDKVTLRRKFAKCFRREAGFRFRDFKDDGLLDLADFPEGPVRVIVRKRPLLEHELADEYDVVLPGSGSVTVLDCRLKADLKHPYIAARCFPFTTLSERASGAALCQHLRMAEVGLKGLGLAF